MKKTILSLLALALTLGAWAEPVNYQQALQQARKFFTAHSITMSAKPSVVRAPAKHGGAANGNGAKANGNASADDAAYYIFNAGADKGFAIISGDDRTAPVLGYSLSGTLTEGNMPDNMRSFLESYAEQIEYIQKHNITITRAASATDRAHIEPMLTTKWDQTSPFNNACPQIGGRTSRAVTGCVATAMAQVLYYNYLRHPQSIVNTTLAQIPAYTCRTRYNGVSTNVSAIPAGSAIDWAAMLPQYGDDATAEQQAAVANLMLYCGAAVQMNYGPSSYGSSASTSKVPDAFKNYFGFDASTQRISRDDSYTNKEWSDLVYNELQNGRVVLYGGQSQAGSGHCFVINGYDANNFFYVNWGWSGLGDGAYLLSILDPEATGTGAGTVDTGYNLDQDIVINAEPAHGGTSALPIEAYNYTQNGNTLSFTLINRGANAAIFNFGFASVASNGALTIVGNMATTPASIANGTYYPDVLATVDLSTLANGTYNIVPVGKTSTSTTWQRLWVGHTLNVTVSNGNVTIDNGGEVSLSATDITATGANKAGRITTLTTTLTNGGSADFEGRLYLFASTTSAKGSAVKNIPAGVIAGGTAELNTDWTPLSAGSYNLWLCSDVDGNNVLAQGSVTIAEGNGQYAMTLTSMTANNEDASSATTDSEGRTVIRVSGNNLEGSYTLTANQTITQGTNFVTFIEKLNETTGEYEDYNSTAYRGGIRYGRYGDDIKAGESVTRQFSFLNLPDGSYIIRPEVGTLQASTYYYMSPELWYDDSRVYVLGTTTGIDAATAVKAQMVDVYNLQGMKVATVSTDKLSTLPRGIYIVNGKKIAVK